MKFQRGSILPVIIFLLVAFGGAVVFGVSTYFSYANQGATIENQLETKRDDNKNVMANFSTSVKEIAQTARMSTDAQGKLIELANKSRYGDGGSKATIQFFQEQNPTADVSVYNKLAQLIESERTRFESSQREMLDIRRTYKTMLDKPYSGFWLRLAGFPKLDLKDFDIVINDYTDQAFKTKRAEAIDLSK